MTYEDVNAVQSCPLCLSHNDEYGLVVATFTFAGINDDTWYNVTTHSSETTTDENGKYHDQLSDSSGRQRIQTSDFTIHSTITDSWDNRYTFKIISDGPYDESPDVNGTLTDAHHFGFEAKHREQKGSASGGSTTWEPKEEWIVSEDTDIYDMDTKTIDYLPSGETEAWIYTEDFHTKSEVKKNTKPKEGDPVSTELQSFKGTFTSSKEYALTVAIPYIDENGDVGFYTDQIEAGETIDVTVTTSSDDPSPPPKPKPPIVPTPESPSIPFDIAFNTGFNTHAPGGALLYDGLEAVGGFVSGIGNFLADNTERLSSGHGGKAGDYLAGAGSLVGSFYRTSFGNTGSLLDVRGSAQGLANEMGEGYDVGKKQGFALGVGHIVGTNALAEAYVGADLATGELLTTSERIDKLAEGSGKLGSTAGTIAGGIRFGQGLKARFAKPKTGVPDTPDAPKTTVIGRRDDPNFQKLRPREQNLLDRLPDQGNPKANWKQNSSVLREEIRKGKPIRDASAKSFPDNAFLPGKKGGKTVRQTFLGAERNILRNEGWTFDGEYWNPPAK